MELNNINCKFTVSYVMAKSVECKMKCALENDAIFLRGPPSGSPQLWPRSTSFAKGGSKQRD